ERGIRGVDRAFGAIFDQVEVLPGEDCTDPKRQDWRLQILGRENGLLDRAFFEIGRRRNGIRYYGVEHVCWLAALVAKGTYVVIVWRILRLNAIAVVRDG